MKTLKVLKITSIIQGLYCLYCFVIFLLIFIGFNTTANTCLQIGTFIFYSTIEFTIFIAPVCFFINLFSFIKERKDPEHKKIIGKKWIWIFVWPIITTVFFLISVLPFIRIPIFS